MLDFDVKRCTRKCSATGRDLTAGETYFSVLEVEGADVVRRDYSAAAWTGPPEGAIAWWESRLPSDENAKPQLAPSEVALELFDRWSHTPGMEDAAYVLALFLVRKRVFRFVDAGFDGRSTEAGHLPLHCPSRAEEYDVPVVEISDDRAAEIQAELVELLYADAA